MKPKSVVIDELVKHYEYWKGSSATLLKNVLTKAYEVCEGPLERRTNALYNMVRIVSEIIERGKFNKHKDVVTVHISELEPRLRTALALANESMKDVDEKVIERDEYFGSPEKMDDATLCERFASTYRIHSNPFYYNSGKAGHDELLKRLHRLRELEAMQTPKPVTMPLAGAH